MPWQAFAEIRGQNASIAQGTSPTQISLMTERTVLEHAQEKMIETQLVRRGIHDPRVLDAMRRVPRHIFIDDAQQELAYHDCALPIEHQQTISQPYIVALMLQSLELQGTERALDVGTGSGYLAALLGVLAQEVVSVERFVELADSARRNLDKLHVQNIDVVYGDGMQGYRAKAPYDAIVVSAAATTIPPALIEQLANHGRLVIPIGDENEQRLLLFQKENNALSQQHLCDCRFVPLLPSIADAN